jgi:hypothetical protein
MPTIPHATEQSTYPVTVDLVDSLGAAITPNNDVTWSLCDEDNNIINSRSSVAYSTPTSTLTIILSGSDLLMQGRSDSELRYLIVRCTYDSSLGTSLPFVGQLSFYVDGVHVVA